MRALILSLLIPFSASASTTVNVDSMSMDGLALRDVHCELASGGLFASMAVAAQLASQADAFNACHPSGAAIRLDWTWQGEQLRRSEVVSTTASGADSCMVRTLGSIRSPLSGTCQTTFLVGDTARAEAAYSSLSPASAPVAEEPSVTPRAGSGKPLMGAQPSGPSSSGK